MSYGSDVDKRKKMQIVLIVGLVIALAAYMFMIMRPSVTGYVVEDECGSIGGTVSHTIKNQDMCSNICTANCLSNELEFHDAQFELRDPECNLCQCYCEESKTFIR